MPQPKYNLHSKATLEATTLTATMWTKCLPVMRVSQSTCLLTASAFKRHGHVTVHFVAMNARTAAIAEIVKDNIISCQPPLAVASALARHAGHGLRSLRKEFGACQSAVHGACRSTVSACAETTSLCPVFLLTLTLRTAFACRAQGSEHAADDVAARTPLTALAVSSPLHLRRFTAGNLRCAADCRRSVLRFAPYRSSIVAAGWTVRHSVALLKVPDMAVCSRRHPTASARS